MSNNKPTRMRWIRRILLSLVVLVALLFLAGWLALRGSLPQLDGETDIAGLSAPVSIERDTLGIVTISAANQHDAARALGYVHAQERSFEMDLLRRAAAGELSELFGAKALDTDRQFRLHRLRTRIHAWLPTLSEEERALLQAYAEGVNAGVSHLRVRPWPYVLLRQAPKQWLPEDTVLAGMAMYFDLQDAAHTDQRKRLRLREHLPPALYALLTHAGSTWDAPLAGHAGRDATLPDAATLDLRTLPMPAADAGTHIQTDIATGSNNFAVAGALTRDGRAIVANDMHLGLRAPNIWFRARLKYPDPRAANGQVDAVGFTLPGLPIIVVGSNGHVAWGFTNSYVDVADLQAIRPCSAAQTQDCTPVRTLHERITVAGASAHDMVIEESDWGPIVERRADGSALALRWVGAQHDAINLKLGELVRADGLKQALSIAETMRLPAQNLLLASHDGRIAWRLVGALPQRGSGCDTTHTVQPAACAAWSVSNAGAPHIVDPPAARLWTANNRNVEGAALQRVGDDGFALGARAKQIRDDLFARQQFDERVLLAVQLDDRALFLQRWQTLLQQVAHEDGPNLRKLAGIAAAPMPRAEANSASYRVVRAWRQAVLKRLADGLTAPAQVAMGKDFALPLLPQFEGVAWPLVTQRPAHLLPRRHASWHALFDDAAGEVLQDLSKRGPLAELNWGEANTAAICHPLARALPDFFKSSLCMPAEPLDGDVAMPRVVAPSFGASERMVVSPGHEADAIAHMPGGQSGHPLSPFWGAGHDAWVHGRPTPLLPGATRYRMALQPAR